MSDRRTALISCYDKTGLEKLARTLVEAGWRIVSTGGTADYLRTKAQVEVIEVSEITGHPSLMDGRVKTLHPAIHAGVLARRHNDQDMQQLQEFGYEPIDMVVVNLYPFEEVAAGGAEESEVLENIDIGGPTLLRAAAKNYPSVTCLSSSDDYTQISAILAGGEEIERSWRKQLAARAFAHVSRYDSLIANYLGQDSGGILAYPEELTLPLKRQMKLRYGENPHQSAAFYSLSEPGPTSLVHAEHLSGPDLSYNNLCDADAAINAVSEFAEAAVCALKHANPCGLAEGESIDTAFRRAYEGDPVSIFGGVVAVNRAVDEGIVDFISEKQLFLDVLIAPGYSKAAEQRLKQREKLKLLKLEGLNPDSRGGQLEEYPDGRFLSGGVLLNSPDNAAIERGGWEVAGECSPADDVYDDLEFAMKVVKHVKSNAVVVVKGSATLGVGAGQMNRVTAAELALKQAGEKADGAVLASDGFLPFPDVAELAAEHNIKAIVQPGGSIRDAQSIEVADAAGMAMVFTGSRHFRH